MSDQELLGTFIANIMKTMENRDLETIMGYFREDVIVLGTGKDEIWVDYDVIKYNWDLTFQVEALEVPRYEVVNLRIKNDVAWASVELDFNLIINEVTYEYEEARITMVFIKEDDGWQIQQWHASIPLIGTEDIEGWPEVTEIQNDIETLLDKLGISPDLTNKERRIRKYLLKAKELTKSL